MEKFNCRICNKEVIRHPGELRKNKTGRIYCSRICRDIDYKNEGNPNFNNHWSDELKQAQSAIFKKQFANGRKVWNKGLDKTNPIVAKLAENLIGNDYGKYSKGSKRPDKSWWNIFNSAGVRFCLQKIHRYKYHAKFWLRLREEVLNRDSFICQKCGKDNCRLEVHHKIPSKMGGSDDMDNLITLCSICHKKEENNARKRAALVRD